MLETLTIDDFRPLLNQTFQVRFTQEYTLPAELIQVRELTQHLPDRRVPFSIVFRTDQKTHYFNQMMVELLHPDKGELLIFVVPIGFDGEGVLYEAVFN